MAIQYQPLPEFQFPNVNLLGAYAQGQALQQQALQEERLKQQMDLAQQAAGYAANRDLRQAEQAQAAAELAKVQMQGHQFDNLAKIRDQLHQDALNINSQKDADAFFSRYEKIAPDLLPSDRRFTPENKRQWMMTSTQFLDATKPYEREYAGPDGKPVKGRFYLNPITQQEIPIGGSEREQPAAYQITKEGAAFNPATGTFKPALMETPAPARGQAGAFTTPEITNQVEQLKPGVARVESGGDYGAQGPEVKRKDGSVDRAYGKYQVMGANIPSWTEQALGRRMTIKEFLANPEAQEKVFEDQFGRNIKKYGSAEDAVSVWFSGRPLAQATKAGARDVNMGVPEYVQKVMAGSVGPYKTAKTVPLTGENPSLQNVPVNAFTPAAAPINAFAAPPVQAPINLAPGLTQPQPQATPMTYTEFVKQPLKIENTKLFTQLLNKAEEMNKANVLPKTEGEGVVTRFKKVAEGALPSDIQRVIDPKAEKLRTDFSNIIDQYIQRLRESGSMTGGEGNTIAELEAKKVMLGKPNMTIEGLRDIIRSLDENLGTGKLKPETGGGAKSVTVNVPGHGAVAFPSQETADAFKREAGL